MSSNKIQPLIPGADDELSLLLRTRLTLESKGLENREQLAFLSHHPKREIQGYRISPPVPAKEFATFLNSDLFTKKTGGILKYIKVDTPNKVLCFQELG